jgi:ABC-type transport system involved in cytochrome c biogenesis permease subunit
MKDLKPFIYFALLVGALTGVALPSHAAAESSMDKNEVFSLLGKLPIQSGGRIKPLQTFAVDTILAVAERRSPRGEQSQEPPLRAILQWLHDGSQWSEKEILYIGHKDAKMRLGLDLKRSVFSPVEVASSSGIQKESELLQKKQSTGDKLNSADQSVLRAINKLSLFQGIATGTAWTMVPTETGWLSLADPKAVDSGVPQLMAETLRVLFDANSSSASSLGAPALSELVPELMSRQAVGLLKQEKAGTLGGGIPENPNTLDALASAMKREVSYNDLRPFQKSWILYLLSFLLFLASMAIPTAKNRALAWGAWAVFFGAFLLHSYGFVVRSLITGRPPVTNMYESTIWVPWGVALFAIIIAALSRKSTRAVMIPMAATALAALSLILSDNIPAVLDPSIKPLEPVLRSNYWLTVHVLTITLSYGAFALSMALGNVVLGLFWLRPDNRAAIDQYSLFMYRAVQFGVILLAAGTILGGIWADYSWGRFWGWDPKETWALIALLFYLAVLHGRWAGWVKTYGMAAWTVLCFNGVLMAWYGVNFVLGVGLHSYGFSSGGLEFIGAFVALQVAFVAAVSFKHRMRAV